MDARTAWASGSRGTVIRTIDGGTTWRVDSIPGASRLDLRSIHARGAQVAHVAATAGRIWRTTDGGQSWSLRYQASDTSVFLDAIAFWDERHGVALGDPMNGRFFLVTTDDGGGTWRESPLIQGPASVDGEAAFAASGSSLLIDGPRGMWIGSGGTAARLHKSTDQGRSWTTFSSPLRQGASSLGIFSLARFGGRIVAVGGDYQVDSARTGNHGIFDSARGEWAPAGAASPRGFRSGIAISQSIAIAVGQAGSDVSTDGGVTWRAFDATGFHAVRVSPEGTFYASGSDGRVSVYHSRAPR